MRVRRFSIERMRKRNRWTPPPSIPWVDQSRLPQYQRWLDENRRWLERARHATTFTHDVQTDPEPVRYIPGERVTETIARIAERDAELLKRLGDD